jgi:hypothetical protein
MARCVTGLFATAEQVNRLDGALRDAGFEAERITIMDPAGQRARIPGQAQERQGPGAWLVEHLVRHGQPRDQAQAYCDRVAHDGRWLVSADIRNDSEEADARNLMVTVGAEEISSAADGSMVMVTRPGVEGTGSQG